MVKALFAMLTLIAAVPASAGQWTPNKANPYRGLFTPQKPATLAAPATPTAATKPTVVCGMTIIPADPTIDPKMSVSPKRDDNLKYTIRAIDPPICNPSR